jgi:hypothetical protein
MSVPIFHGEQARLVISNLTADSYKIGAGRRPWVAYRDFGVAEATGGQLHFVGARFDNASEITTGWHYHTCELLIAYYLSGWIDLYVQSGELMRAAAS